MNIFEGARRIAIVVSAIAVLGSLAAIHQDKPVVLAEFRVPGFNAAPIKDGNCDSSTDQAQYESLRTPSDIPYRLNLCFAGRFSPEHNNPMIEFMKTDEGQLWAARRYSPELQEYIDSYLQHRFKPSTADLSDIDSEYRTKRWSQIGYGLGSLFAGLAIFWGFVWTTGWIVRGFMGIPRGQDHRPNTSMAKSDTVIPT